MGYSPWDRKELDTTEQLSTFFCMEKKKCVFQNSTDKEKNLKASSEKNYAIYRWDEMRLEAKLQCQMKGHGRTTEKERSGQTLKEVWENSPSRHTRIPKKALSKMNTKAKLTAEKCDEFEGFRAYQAKIGPQAGSLAQHKLYWVVLGQACRRGRVSLSRNPSQNSVGECVCVCVCLCVLGGWGW